MRKGYKFEHQIQKVLDYVNNVGGHAHKNHAERLQDGTYIKGEPFDYEVFLENYKAVFDAKECATDTWHMLKKDIVQAENLKHCKNAGIDAYFLIYFKDIGVLEIDIDKVIKVLEQGKKSISYKLGVEWKLLSELGGKSNERRNRANDKGNK